MKESLIFFTIMGAILFASSAYSTIIHVPSAQPTIQAGIDAAIPGDTVLVADGTYTGEGNWNIDFGGKNIHLKSENGPEMTIIDCGDESLLPREHFGIYFHNAETNSSVIRGFTIKDGNFGIMCEGAAPIIRDNIISNNAMDIFEDEFGGGIVCINSSPGILNNEISDNFGGGGGGIRCVNSNPNIIANTVKNNNAIRGGGIYCGYNSNAQIIENTISENYAWGFAGNGDGGGIAIVGSNTNIEGNYIFDNVTFGGSIGPEGSAVYSVNSSFTFSHNIVVGNKSDYGGGNYGRGDVFYCADGSPIFTNNTIFNNNGPFVLHVTASPVFHNNIIAFNNTNRAVFVSEFTAHECNLELNCTDIYGNSGGDWIDDIADQVGISGNLSADPLFCDTTHGDYRISSHSPCAPDNNNCGTLIGALDVGCTYPICGDLNFDEEVTIIDITFLVDYYFYGGPPPTHTYNGDINCDGIVNLVDLVRLNRFVLHDGTVDCCQ